MDKRQQLICAWIISSEIFSQIQAITKQVSNCYNLLVVFCEQDIYLTFSRCQEQYFGGSFMEKQYWKVSKTSLARAESHIFIKWIDISSGQWAFWILRDLNSFSISSFSENSDKSLELVLYDWVSGIKLLLFTIVKHCQPKKLLKISFFCLKSVIRVLLCSNGEMSGVFSHYKMS